MSRSRSFLCGAIALVSLLSVSTADSSSSSSSAASSSSLHLMAASKFECNDIRADKYSFDLSALSKPFHISNTESTPPTTTRTSIDISLCSALPIDDRIPSDEQCPKGTRACITIVNLKQGDKDRVVQVIPVIVETNGGDVELLQSKAGEDYLDGDGGKKTTSLKLELGGGFYANKQQRGEIFFQCDPNAADDAKPTLKKYDRPDGELELRWRTKHACPRSNGGGGDHKDDKDEKQPDGEGSHSGSGGGGGWGFFSWFFFLLFLGFGLYFALGTYRNYNEYGKAEIPHADFWRETPYLARDVARQVVHGFGGGGGGGGGAGRGRYEPI